MNMKNLLLLFLLALGSPASFAQSFTLVVPDSVKTDTLNSEIIFDVSITNITNSPLLVYMVRKSNMLPENWASSVCFDVCFAPNLDSVATTSAYSSAPLSSGETRTMSLHVFPAVNQGTAYVKLVVGNLNNPSEYKTINLSANASVTSIHDISAPDGFYLGQNYPNPFNPSTVINYSVAKAGQVTLKLYNIVSVEVASLVNEFKVPGNYYYTLNGKDLSSGVYLYKLNSGHSVSVKKMIFMK
jgi:hypothetical protein